MRAFLNNIKGFDLIFLVKSHHHQVLTIEKILVYLIPLKFIYYTIKP